MLKRVAHLSVAAVVALAPSGLRAQGVTIDHKPVGCIVAGKYPKMNACFTPSGKLARARVYFRAEEGGTNWYYVEMKSDAPCFAGILPKPKKNLIGKKVLYYVDAFDQQFTENRTPDNPADVVANERDCKKDIPVAPFVTNASVTVFPSLPAGFAAAGLATGTAVALGAGAAAVVGGGVAIAASGGNDNNNTTPTTAGGGGTTTTTQPPPANSTTTTTTTSTTQPASSAFRPVFRISPQPPVGVEPLTVEFNMCDSEGDNLRFRFDYNGDGSEDDGGDFHKCRTTRTFRISGISLLPGTLPSEATYNTRMRVFEAVPGGGEATDDNVVKVMAAAFAASATPSRGLTGLSGSRAATPAPGRRLAWNSQLDVADGSGQVVVNGSTAVFSGPGRSTAMALGQRGENRIEAQLVQGSGRPGTWRFELGSTASLEPGSLRVVAGNVAMISGDAVVFRLGGRPGERVVFTFKTGR
jgi:hypothetical protein